MSLPSKPVPSKFNQSPEETFDMPLFPGYVRSVPTLQPHMPAQQVRATNAAPTTKNSDTDVEKLLKQYGELSQLVQEQTRLHYKQSQQLQQQMKTQAAQHQSELHQLEQAWSHRLDTVIANTQKAAATPADAYQTVHPSTVHTVPHQARPTNSRNRQASRRPSPLQGVSTTYQVARRPQVRWVEKLLGSVPALVSLVVMGTVIAALSALALSPNVLWPSLSIVIQAVIPFIFVTGLIGIGITAVWSSAR
ncbi:MAG: hypothetical protein ACFB0D_04080 [Phormidesmis sp.]